MSSRLIALLLFASVLGTQAGCASRSTEVRPIAADARVFRDLPCESLYDELDRTDAQALEAAQRVDSRFADNAALILVSGLVWPAALGLRADGDEARRLGELRGQHEALRAQIAARPCQQPAALSNARLAVDLALQPGDRFIYHSSAREQDDVVAEVSLMRAGRIELNGGLWAQDRAGNRLPAESVFDFATPPVGGAQAEVPLPYVVGLLKTGLRLGQSLQGALVTAGDAAALEVTGEVVALGPASLSNAAVPTATIEFEGRAIDPMPGNSGARPAVHGVLVVDSRNGMLVRLQTRPSPTLPAMDVRLLRVERSKSASP